MTWLTALAAGGLVLLVGARLRPVSTPAALVVASGRSSRRARRYRWVGAAGVVVLSYATFGVGGLIVLGVVAAGLPRLVQRRQQRHTERERQAAVPDLVELFVVAASAGLPVATAVGAVAERAPLPLRDSVTAAGQRFERGIPLAECLARLGSELGPSGEPLVAALAESVVSGAPLVDRLGAVADRARDSRRQRALEAARRLPVAMLFPLVGCILPAAVVLAVVPVVLVSFSALAP